jgi:thiamine transporter
MQNSSAKQRRTTLMLTESAVMIALAFILSFLKVVDMPYGGSVTAFSMLPIIIIAYRYSTGWGLAAGFAFSLLQMLMGLSSLSYATSAAAAVAIILLDYIVAFTVMGLGGVFRRVIKDQGSAMAVGALLACVLRYICHVVSGCTVWAGVSIPTSDGLIYSMGYNATYMIPETLMTIVGAYYVGSLFTITEAKIVRRPASGNKNAFSVIAALPVVLAVVVSAAFIFGMMQNPDDGSFDISAISGYGINSWVPVIVSMILGVVISIAVAVYGKVKRSTK